MCFRQRQTSVAASNAPAQPEGSLTAEQRAAVFGSAEAAGRQTTPKSKRKAVSLACAFSSVFQLVYLGPFCGAIAFPSVTRCRYRRFRCRRRRRGHRCASGVRQWQQ